MKEQYLACGEREVEIWSLRHDADEALHFHLLRPHVVIANPCLPISRPYARCKNPDCGRLPGAVWTKQSEDLSGVYVERQPIQRHDLARRLVFLTTHRKSSTRGERWRRCKDLAQISCANS